MLLRGQGFKAALIDWQPVWVHLSPYDRWDRLQPLCDPELGKGLRQCMDGHKSVSTSHFLLSLHFLLGSFISRDQNICFFFGVLHNKDPFVSPHRVQLFMFHRMAVLSWPFFSYSFAGNLHSLQNVFWKIKILKMLICICWLCFFVHNSALAWMVCDRCWRSIITV